MESFLKKECDLKYFHDNGYIRKKCKKCNDYFWTLDEKKELCGDKPCEDYSFIGSPLGKKQLNITQVRESFLSFFQKHGHTRIKYPKTGERCPVVARWRTDIYLTIASIADFQPHVTSGEVPPPANPLVISQPCIRLNDLDEVGVSGRHLTTFEMMGHHAFNKNKDEIYFKEKTVKLCDEYFVEKIGIPREKINYKEQLWDGGGNAGPCLEVLAGGLEIATLVFMNMKEDEKGKIEINNKKYSPNPLNIVDTGYGLERIAWLTNGSKTIYETVFPELVTWLKENSKNKKDMKSIYSLADHSKCLAFMLGDGIVPSNVKAGYLARLIIRRALRFIDNIEIEFDLKTIVSKELDLLEEEFPELKNNKKQIQEILELETRKYNDTLRKGEGLIKRTIKEKNKIDKNKLITLYDTHGMPPEIVKKIAKKQGINVIIPKNFDSMIAELHSHDNKQETKKQKKLKLPETHPLYYDNHYIKKFKAKILWSNKKNNETEIVLDQTAFYPEGGGQPGDKGFIKNNGKKYNVINVEKQGCSIIHKIDGFIEKGEKVEGEINWERRYTIMKHHTGTHVVNGALRTYLGEHIWQAGSQLNVEDARFDFSHYKNIKDKDIKQIEKIANQLINKGQKVEKKVMDRNSAEKTYGFRLYQGGVPPGNLIRVLNIPNIDVEACGGTHLDNINEIDKIKIIKNERIQDGVNRVIFSAGKMADLYKEKEEQIYNQIIITLKPIYEIKNKGNISEELKEISKIFSVPINQLNKTLKRFVKDVKSEGETKSNDLKDAVKDLFNKWKETQKNKKKIPETEIKKLKQNEEQIPGTQIIVISAKTAYDSVAAAGEITSNPNYIAHIYDGKKLTSTASSNVNIDLRDIVKDIAKILGGGGGGKPKMTQCGGPNKDKADQALLTAKKLTIDLLKKN